MIGRSLALLLLAGTAAAGPSPARALDLAVESDEVQPRIVAASLTTSKGTPFRFPDDLFAKGGPVLLSFTLTGCLQQCPYSDAVMDRVAELARAEGRADLTLATLTLNPVDDTPEHLDRERARHLAPERIFLTGHPAQVFAVLDGLGLRGGPSEDHALRFVLLRNRDEPAEASDTIGGPEDLYEWVRSAY